MPPAGEWPELGIDQLDPTTVDLGQRWLWFPRRRPALGVGPTAAPTLLFVVLGAVLGPSGLNILTRAVLVNVQAIPWVALAVMGVFIGLGLARSAPSAAGKALISSGIIALITVATVTTGLFVLVSHAHIHTAGNLLASSILIGLCASVSAALPTTVGGSGQLRRAAYLADLDDVPLALFGTAVVAALAGGSVALRLIVTVGGGGAIGLAGLLLFERANESERGLFVTGTVLLLAGIGAYLGTSPLLSGGAAAMVWLRAPGVADRITARDLRVLQHPLMALLLILAGAMLRWNTMVLWVTAYVVVLRFAAKLLASVVVNRVADVSPALLATVLLQPGVMGIAFAVNVGLVGGRGYDWVVSTVTTSVVASEILAAFLPYAREDTA